MNWHSIDGDVFWMIDVSAPRGHIKLLSCDQSPDLTTTSHTEVLEDGEFAHHLEAESSSSSGMNSPS